MGLNAVWENISDTPPHDLPNVSNSYRYAGSMSGYIWGYTYFLWPRLLKFWAEENCDFFLTHRSDLSAAHWAMPVTSNRDGPSLFIRKATMEKFQGRRTN